MGREIITVSSVKDSRFRILKSFQKFNNGHPDDGR